MSDPRPDEVPADAVAEDVLGAPYTAETIVMPDDAEGPVVVTLVKKAAATPTTRAVLYLHGFSDYFFQTEFADWWTDRGYDFYALDLRKYGRSLLAHQSPAYVADLHEYFADLDAAWQRITRRDGHTDVVVTAHSTGGLVAPLWADARQPSQLVGMVLNSPWLDLQGSSLVRVLGTPVIRLIGRYQPMRELGRDVTGFYARSLHRDYEGEWDFDLQLKPLGSMKVYLGWLRAIRIGQARLHRGLDLPCPVLVLSSDISGRAVRMDELVHQSDIVLDVRQIRRWSTALGRRVTYVAIPGAVHDVVLSRRPARERAYAEIASWLEAYVGDAPLSPARDAAGS